MSPEVSYCWYSRLERRSAAILQDSGFLAGTTSLDDGFATAGFYPDPKLRLLKRGSGRFEDRAVHEDVKLQPGQQAYDAAFHYDSGGRFDIIHHSYPTLSDYIEHMNRYSSLGAEMVLAKGKGRVRFSVVNIVLRPMTTFIYNYFFRLGFLDGREGLLLHLYHAVYVSWKYAKAWELSRNESSSAHDRPVV